MNMNYSRTKQLIIITLETSLFEKLGEKDRPTERQTDGQHLLSSIPFGD